MNLGALDWLVLLIPVALVAYISYHTKKYVRSVADYMSASRVAGRYLVAVAQGEASFGAISVVAAFEVFFVAGFTQGWWLQANNVVWLFILLSGFIIYRYRESRVMTLAQFFELRYSKSFRLFAGFLAFTSGIIAYGIYPGVGARFFVYFCGFPDIVHLGGLEIQTYVIFMILLLVPGVLLTCLGGQLTLMVVDCVEGLISMVFYMFIAIALIWMFSWSDISTSMQMGREGKSMFNPFDQGKVDTFNFWYMAIAIFAAAYGWQSTQAGHGFRSAAINAHEQKMGAIIGPWRNEARTLLLTILCITAFCFLHHPNYAVQAQGVRDSLAHIGSPTLQTQMEVPAALGVMLPTVIKGMFAAVILFALISTDCTMMHSWGTIFVQDLVVPLRKKALSTESHLTLLRAAVIGVSIFAFTFSYFYKPNQFINMFGAIASALFSGAGAAIIGGFYWRKGTSAGAWGAMISGAVVSLLGFTMQQTWSSHLYPWLMNHAPGFMDSLKYFLEDVCSSNVPQLNWKVTADKPPFNGQWVLLFATLTAIFSYVSLSLLTFRQSFELDKLLHRGKYADEHSSAHATATADRKFSIGMLIGITPEFTKTDKAISISLFSYRFMWFLIFAAITTWNLINPWPNQWWVSFFHWTSVVLPFAIGITVTVWFTIGGIKDLKQLFVRLKNVQRDASDDGTVHDDAH